MKNNNDIINDKTINKKFENQDSMLQEKPIGVYVKQDENGNIIEVNSDIFIDDFTGWKKIAEGYGDKFAHAQTQWFENENTMQ